MVPSSDSTSRSSTSSKTKNKGARSKKAGDSAGKNKDGAKARASSQPKIVKLIKTAIETHCMMTLDPVRNEFRNLTEKLIDAQGKIIEQKSHLAKFDSKMKIKVREGENLVEKLVDFVPSSFQFSKMHFQMPVNIRKDEDMVQISKDGIAL